MTMAVREAMAPVRGAPPSIEWVALADLAIDTRYQRTIDSRDAKDAYRRIALAWDWRLCGVLVVARRFEDGGQRLFVIDGQHRLEGARLRGDIAHLPCVIAAFDDVAAEADCFVALNARRRALKPVQLHRAALAAGDAEAIDLDRALVAVGLTLTPSADWRVWLPDALPNIAGLRAFRKRYGVAALDRSLRVFADAWRGAVRRNPGTMFNGIGGVLTDPDPKWGGGGRRAADRRPRRAGCAGLARRDHRRDRNRRVEGSRGRRRVQPGLCGGVAR